VLSSVNLVRETSFPPSVPIKCVNNASHLYYGQARTGALEKHFRFSLEPPRQIKSACTLGYYSTTTISLRVQRPMYLRATLVHRLAVCLSAMSVWLAGWLAGSSSISISSSSSRITDNGRGGMVGRFGVAMPIGRHCAGRIMWAWPPTKHEAPRKPPPQTNQLASVALFTRT